MAFQSFGEGTILDPVVTIGGVAYSLAVRFNRYPTNRDSAASVIVTGTVEEVTSLSGSRKQLKMRRDFRSSSTTVVNGPGDSFERETQHLCGGNIAATSEPERIYSWNEDMAYRGADARSRVVKADAAWATVAGVAKGFLVTEATPYGIEPDEVNYVGSDPLPTPWAIVPSFNAVALSTEDDCETVFTPGSADSYSDCAVTWRSSTTLATGTVARRIFQRGDPLADDAEYYPDDAAFAVGSAEYWFSPRGRSFRFGTVGLGSTGADEIRVANYQRRSDFQGALAATETDSPMVLATDDSPAGYGGTDDAVALAGVTVIEATTVVLDIVSGSGFLEYRAESESDSRVAVLAWDASADIASRKQRTSDGGSLGTLALVGGAYSFPFQVKVAVTATTVVFSHRQNSAAAWVDEASITINHDSGRLCIGTLAAVKFAGLTTTLYNLPIGCDSSLAVRRTSAFTAQSWSQSYTLPVATAITSVRNGTTGALMELAGEETTNTARNVYAADAATLTVFSESVGDLIEVVQAAAGSAPAGPGDPPRTNNQTNFGGGGTDTAENIANWHDLIIVHDPNGEFPSAPGTVVTFRRDPVFDSQNPPTIQADVKGRALSDWTTVSAANYYADWVGGWIFFRESYVTALALTGAETICVRALGKKFSQRGGVSALVYNDAVESLECLDGAWADAGLVSALADTVSGATGAGATRCQPYPTGFTCTLGFWEADGVAYGVVKSALHALSDALAAGSAPFGSYFFDTAVTFPSEALHAADTALRTAYTSAGETTLPACGSQPPKGSHDAVSAGDYVSDLLPFAKLGIAGMPIGHTPGIANPNYFGGFLLPPTAIQYGGYSPAVAADFGFAGVAFAPAGWFENLPDGATIVEAHALVRIGDAKIIGWDQEYNLQPDGTLYVRYRQGGSSVIEYDGPVTGGGTLVRNTPPTAPTSGAITLALLGRRRNSKRIPLVGGGTYNAPANDFVSYGSGIAVGTATSGKWKKIDVTGMIQLLANNRNSVIADWELWPTVGMAAPTGNAGALAGYLDSLMPTRDCTLIPGSGNGTWGFESTQAGRYCSFSTLEIGVIKARVRLPSGLLADEVLPVPQAPMIAGWS